MLSSVTVNFHDLKNKLVFKIIFAQLSEEMNIFNMSFKPKED